MNKTTLLLILAITAQGAYHAALANDHTDKKSPKADQANLEGKVRQVIIANGLQADPARGRDIPSIHSAKAQLGMRLFFNKALGGMKDTACVSCHHPLLGGSDDLSLPIGTGAAVPDLLGLGAPVLMALSVYHVIPPPPSIPRCGIPCCFGMGG